MKASAKRLLSQLHDKLVLELRRKAATYILDVLDADLPADPYPPEVFDAKVQAILDHVATAFGDEGNNVYQGERVDAASSGAGVAVVTAPDLSFIADEVLEGIRRDAEFASLVAMKLGLPGGAARAASRRSSTPTRTTPSSSSPSPAGICEKASPARQWKAPSSSRWRAS